MHHYFLHPAKLFCFLKSAPSRFCVHQPPQCDWSDSWSLPSPTSSEFQCRKCNFASSVLLPANTTHKRSTEFCSCTCANSIKTKVARGHNTLRLSTFFINIPVTDNFLIVRRPSRNCLLLVDWWLIVVRSSSRSHSRANKHLFESDICHQWCFGCPSTVALHCFVYFNFPHT